MVYSERPDDYIRIYNMHSTHAVLFVDDDCRKRVQLAIAQGRDKVVDAQYAFLSNLFIEASILVSERWSSSTYPGILRTKWRTRTQIELFVCSVQLF